MVNYVCDSSIYVIRYIIYLLSGLVATSSAFLFRSWFVCYAKKLSFCQKYFSLIGSTWKSPFWCGFINCVTVIKICNSFAFSLFIYLLLLTLLTSHILHAQTWIAQKEFKPCENDSSTAKRHECHESFAHKFNLSFLQFTC